MPTSISAIVASYGDVVRWSQLAQRALLSIKNQVPQASEILRVHGESMSHCRNIAAAQARSEWLCFLDCDDELEPGYIHAMLVAAEEGGGYPELLYPRVRYVTESLTNPKFMPAPVTLPPRDLRTGNHMVIGTLVRWDLFAAVGGFREWDAYEDWDLWIRCVQAGARVRLVENAIYRAHRRAGSRNIVKDAHRIFKEIHDANYGPS